MDVSKVGFELFLTLLLRSDAGDAERGDFVVLQSASSGAVFKTLRCIRECF